MEEVLPDGTRYSGQKYMDLPNGLGKKIYTNEEVYEGDWRRGQREGWGT